MNAKKKKKSRRKKKFLILYKKRDKQLLQFRARLRKIDKVNGERIANKIPRAK